jgi:hypothetical protein
MAVPNNGLWAAPIDLTLVHFRLGPLGFSAPAETGAPVSISVPMLPLD